MDQDRIALDVQVTDKGGQPGSPGAGSSSSGPDYKDVPLHELADLIRQEFGNAATRPRRRQGPGGRYISDADSAAADIDAELDRSREEREINKQMEADAEARIPEAEEVVWNGEKPPVTDQWKNITNALKDALGGEGSGLLGNMVSGITGEVTGSGALGGLAGQATTALMGTEALAALAGPIGMALLAAKAVSEVNDANAARFDARVKGTAAALTGDRGSIDYLGGLGEAYKESTAWGMDPGQKLTGGLLNLNPVDDALRSLVDATLMVVHGFDEMGEKMKDFSVHVAAADAAREVRQINTELFRAQELGPAMGKWMDARSRGEESLEQIKIMLMSRLLPAATRILEIIVTQIEILEKIASGVDKTIEFGENAVNTVKDGFVDGLAELGVNKGVAAALFEGVFTLMFPTLQSARWWFGKESEEGDALINEQFKRFIDPVNFHKNIAPTLPMPRRRGGAGAGGP